MASAGGYSFHMRDGEAITSCKLDDCAGLAVLALKSVKKFSG